MIHFRLLPSDFVCRCFTHLDADAFFASVEQAADPRLRGKPIAVGGEKRGIIASASYEARQFGVFTPMSTVRARQLCPRLIVLPGDFEKYERFSRWMFSYAYDFTPDVEISSIDEGYFDLTSARRSPVEIARTIRDAIRQALKISVSEGLGGSKLVSQIASKYRKPAAFKVVPPGGEIPFLHPLPNRWLPGIGPKTALRFNAAGLTHIHHIAATPLDRLSLLVGGAAPQLRDFANGIDDRPVIPASEPAQSYSQQETFEADQTDEAFIEATLRRMADHLFAKVRTDGKCVRTLTVKVRYNDMDEDQCSESLAEPTDLETDVYSRLHAMLRRAWKRRVSLRLVSLKLSNLYNDILGAELALDRAAQQHDARRRLASTVDALREEHGRYSVMRGHDLGWKAEGGRRHAEVGPAQARPRVSPSSARFGADRKSEVRSPKSESDSRCCSVPSVCLARPYTETQKAQGSAEGSSAPTARETSLPSGTGHSESQTRTRDEGRARSHPSALSRADAVRRRPPPIRAGTSAATTAIPLCVRSHYSFLNSTLSPEDIVGLAKRHGLMSVALCDQGNLHGAPAFAAAARAAGIQPILGAEIEVNGKPLRLYVENLMGYRNLCRLLSQRPKSESPSPQENRSPVAESGSPCFSVSSVSWCLDKFNTETRSTPRRTEDLPLQKSGPSDWFRMSDVGCRASEAFGGLLAISSDASLAPCFPGRFYLGITHPDELRRLHNPDRMPVVAWQPVHYAAPADRWQWDILQSIRTLTLLRQEHPGKQLDGEFHFRPPGELANLFRECPGLLRRTQEIAERCVRFEFPFGKPQFPAFRTPDGSSSREFLCQLVLRGFEARYAGSRTTHHAPHPDLSRLRAQVETELQIIHDVGYEDYFLIVWDLLGECRARGIDWITRGSAADSLVCYCLGISSVCPVRFDLYFRRFLNPERMALNKLPDIDIDFPHDRKDDVVDLLFAKYGPEHCAVVGGFSTFKARSAFAEAAKVLGVAERDVRRFTEHFPWRFEGGQKAEGRPSSAATLLPGGERQKRPGEASRQSALCNLPSALAEQLRLRPETADLPLDEEPYRSALRMAEVLDGRPRYPKMHPCGVVLSRQPIHELTPTFVSPKGWATTQFDMDAVEAVGLVKMDILAQGGLAVMRDTQAALARRNRAVDLERFEVRTLAHPKAESRKPKEAGIPGADSNSASFSVPSVARCSGQSNTETQGGTGDRNAFQASTRLVRHSALPAPRFDHAAVWDLIASGNARAVHHIESPAMISLCRMTNVRDIDTLIAIVSVIRPGAANEDKKREFTRRYQGLSPVTWPHPSLEPCLRSTFGLVVYEEHILQICEAFAGLSGGRADVLRRSLVKENWPVVKGMEQEFVASARKQGHSEEDIARVWAVVTGFHGYAFCKAHSTAYGVEAYQSAWLKRHFPAEFMAAVLTHGKGFYRPLVYVLECWRLGIGMLPPRVNEPGPGFAVVRPAGSPRFEVRSPKRECGLTPDRAMRCSAAFSGASDSGQFNPGTHRTPKDTEKRNPVRSADFGVRTFIRPPLASIASITERTQVRLLAERKHGKFTSLADFYRRVQPLRDELEILSRAGALDEFGQTRCEQFWEIQQRVAHGGERVEPGQGWLFQESECRSQNAEVGSSGASAIGTLPSAFAEPSRLQRLQWEAELLGFPVSGHPLELYPDMAWDTYCPVSRLGAFVGEEVTLCGLVIEDRVHHQVTGEPMKFLTLCDWTGMVETELFADTYKSYGLATVRYPVLEVTGRVEPFENGRGHTLRVLRAGKPRTSARA